MSIGIHLKYVLNGYVYSRRTENTKLLQIPNGGDEELPSCLGELARKEFFFKFVSHFSISPYLHCMINYH